MMLRNPCWNKGVDCPDRSDTCAIYCEKWKAYCEERQKMYDKRRRDIEANSFVDICFERAAAIARQKNKR